MVKIRIIPNVPALQIQLENEKILCIADLHIGFEKELENSGIKIPSQTHKILKSIQQLLDKINPSKLIILGDIKHEITIPHYREIDNIYGFLETLSEKIRIEIVPGNHDGQIEAIVPPKVKVHSSRGIVIKEEKEVIGLIHGHAWPKVELLGAQYLIIAHIHPLIQLTTETGFKMVYPVWIKATWNTNCIAKAYLKFIKTRTTENPIQQIKKLFGVEVSETKIIIMPAYNKMLGGIPINTTQKLLGPLLKANCVPLSNMEIYLLDGTYLGKLTSLKSE